MSNQRIRVVQIGIEHDHGPDTMRTMQELPELYEILGYAIPEDDPDDNPFRNPLPFAKLPRYSVEEALSLPDLDAVIVECADEHLTKYALLAAKRGLPVHMDKPGGFDPQEFAELISTVKEKNLPLQLGYMYRYNPAVEKVLQDIQDGKLGRVLCVEAHMDCMHRPEKRQWLAKYPGGELFFLGCHLIDLVYRIMGEPEAVIPLSCATGVDGVTGKDYGMAVLQYPTGPSFVKTCAIEPGGFLRRQLVVCGSKGAVQLLPFEKPTEDGLQLTGVREVYEDIQAWAVEGKHYETEHTHRYQKMMSAFAAQVRGEEKNPYTPDYEWKLHKLLLRCCDVKEGEQ